MGRSWVKRLGPMPRQFAPKADCAARPEADVVQEALACGVPAVVTGSGGPRFIVRHGVSGFVTGSDAEFCERIVHMAREESLRREMGRAARQQVEDQPWDRVFQEVYDAYAHSLA